MWFESRFAILGDACRQIYWSRDDAKRIRGRSFLGRAQVVMGVARTLEIKVVRAGKIGSAQIKVAARPRLLRDRNS
jgi:hypothetical protein